MLAVQRHHTSIRYSELSSSVTSRTVHILCSCLGSHAIRNDINIYVGYIFRRLWLDDLLVVFINIFGRVESYHVLTLLKTEEPHKI